MLRGQVPGGTLCSALQRLPPDSQARMGRQSKPLSQILVSSPSHFAASTLLSKNLSSVPELLGLMVGLPSPR